MMMRSEATMIRLEMTMIISEMTTVRSGENEDEITTKGEAI